MTPRVSVLVFAGFLASCGKPAPPPAPVPPAPAATASDDVAILTRINIVGWVASAPDHSRLGVHTASMPGTGPTSAPTGDMLREADDFARKYGFADYDAYDRVRRRIALGHLWLMKARLRAQQEALIKKRIDIAKDVVIDERADPENKAKWRAEMMTALEELQALPPQDPPLLPVADLKLVEEYDSLITSADQAAK